MLFSSKMPISIVWLGSPFYSSTAQIEFAEADSVSTSTGSFTTIMEDLPVRAFQDSPPVHVEQSWVF